MSTFEGISMCSLLKSEEAASAQLETNDRLGSENKERKEWLLYQRTTIVGKEEVNRRWRKKRRNRKKVKGVN